MPNEATGPANFLKYGVAMARRLSGLVNSSQFAPMSNDFGLVTVPRHPLTNKFDGCRSGVANLGRSVRLRHIHCLHKNCTLGQ